MITRNRYLELMRNCLARQPICAILGARQIGKTTLAQNYVEQYFQGKYVFFDLEDPEHLQKLQDPKTVLSAYDGYLIVIDEIQRRPDLFPILRVLVDHRVKKYTFLILGSASKELIRQSAETLTGRIGYIELPPLMLSEVTEYALQAAGFTVVQKQQRQSTLLLSIVTDTANNLLIRGGFPRSYLATSEKDSFDWRKDYITTFLERDLPAFGFDISPQLMYRLWMMLCFYHGQMLNGAAIAQSLMISDKTVRSYLDILAGTFMIRILQPWHENIAKRQVKTPKIYFRDSGMYTCLQSIHSLQELVMTPKIGALWEGFALEQVINFFQVPAVDCYFWSTSNAAELDLLILKDGKKIGFEFKYADAPKVTKSMHIALQDLKLDHLYVIYPGSSSPFVLQEKITACSLQALDEITQF